MRRSAHIRHTSNKCMYVYIYLQLMDSLSLFLFGHNETLLKYPRLNPLYIYWLFLQDKELHPYLRCLQDAGKKIFLITNSPFETVNVGMTFQVGEDWRSLFDVSYFPPLSYVCMYVPALEFEVLEYCYLETEPRIRLIFQRIKVQPMRPTDPDPDPTFNVI